MKSGILSFLVYKLLVEDFAMQKLIFLYWGTVFLMYLSQACYPVGTRLDGRHTGRYSFMRRRSDLFMVIVIVCMTCFSFLRNTYNDSPLSSKRQKNIYMMRHLATGAVF